MQAKWFRKTLFSVLLAGATAPVLAVDGVIEINQAKAQAGNVTPGDMPGFPVTITIPGSYRLTSDLAAPANYDGVTVGADNVTLDLNGFNVVGGGGLFADGIGLSGFQNIEVRNGTIRGFSRNGIFSNINTNHVRVIGVRAIGNAGSGIELQGSGGHLVERCTAVGNGSLGIRVIEGSLIVDSVAKGNGSFGLVLGSSSGFHSNVITENNGGNANPQTAGGLQLGSNVCGFDLICP